MIRMLCEGCAGVMDARAPAQPILVHPDDPWWNWSMEPGRWGWSPSCTLFWDPYCWMIGLCPNTTASDGPGASELLVQQLVWHGTARHTKGGGGRWRTGTICQLHPDFLTRLGQLVFDLDRDPNEWWDFQGVWVPRAESEEARIEELDPYGPHRLRTRSGKGAGARIHLASGLTAVFNTPASARRFLAVARREKRGSDE